MATGRVYYSQLGAQLALLPMMALTFLHAAFSISWCFKNNQARTGYGIVVLGGSVLWIIMEVTRRKRKWFVDEVDGIRGFGLSDRAAWNEVRGVKTARGRYLEVLTIRGVAQIDLLLQSQDLAMAIRSMITRASCGPSQIVTARGAPRMVSWLLVVQAPMMAGILFSAPAANMLSETLTGSSVIGFLVVLAHLMACIVGDSRALASSLGWHCYLAICVGAGMGSTTSAPLGPLNGWWLCVGLQIAGALVLSAIWRTEGRQSNGRT